MWFLKIVDLKSSFKRMYLLMYLKIDMCCFDGFECCLYLWIEIKFMNKNYYNVLIVNDLFYFKFSMYYVVIM